MVTSTRTFGTHSTHGMYRPSEPPGVTEVRSDFDNVLNGVVKDFVNQSARNTELGFKQIDAGQFITLAQLKQLINKG